MLDDFPVLMAHAVHQGCYAVGLEKAHEVVFQRHVELGGTGVALSAGAPAELAVYAPRFVAFGTDDSEATCTAHFFGQFDVGTPSGHVGGDGHFSGLAGFGDDFGFPLVLFGVEYVVVYLAQGQHFAQLFGNVHRGSAHEHRSACFAEFDDFVNDGVVFFPRCFEHQVFAVFADYLYVRGDDDDIELIDFP